jgi:hypothetical protein
MGNAYQKLVKKCEGKRPFLKRILQKYISIDLKETGYKGVDWIHLRIRVYCEQGNRLPDPIKGWEIIDWLRNY